MYEHKRQPLAPRHIYYQRIYRNLAWSSFFLLICLGIGILGYHFTCNLPWIDALHNASMILSGMGPVVEIESDGGKVFSSGYAIFSGVAFITNIGVLLAPAIHRFFHRLHVEE
jgi:hypothetical protein